MVLVGPFQPQGIPGFRDSGDRMLQRHASPGQGKAQSPFPDTCGQ